MSAGAMRVGEARRERRPKVLVRVIDLDNGDELRLQASDQAAQAGPRLDPDTGILIKPGDPVRKTGRDKWQFDKGFPFGLRGIYRGAWWVRRPEQARRCS